MAISIEFALNQEEIEEARKLHPSFKYARYIVAVVLGGFVLYFLPPGFFDVENAEKFSANIVALLLAFLVLFFTRNLTKKIAAKTFKDSVCGVTTAYSFSAEGIRMSTPDTDSKVKWAHLKGWSEGKSVFVLFAGNVFYAIPLRCVGDEEKVGLRELFVEHIGPRGGS